MRTRYAEMVNEDKYVLTYSTNKERNSTIPKKDRINICNLLWKKSRKSSGK